MQSARLSYNSPVNPTERRDRSVRTSEAWLLHFVENAIKQRDIPWHLGADASPADLKHILPSLRGWQLGETSDGRHLLKAAANYARRLGDRSFVDAVKLFIQEEQRHGEHLGQFLDLAGVPRARFDWGDWLFRSVRYFLPSMEMWATPVLMVETHAMIYYGAIRRASSSRVLRSICAQILSDEVPHLRFQCERLAILTRSRPRWGLALTQMLRSMFFSLVTLAIWIGHRRALKAGGYRFTTFWRTAHRRMKRMWHMALPTTYTWVCRREAGSLEQREYRFADSQERSIARHGRLAGEASPPLKVRPHTL